MKNTMKELRNNPAYIATFQTTGNAKLTDYYNADLGVWYRYAQFNLPSRRTCPFRTPDCEKFCYAKRDERFPSPRVNREKNFAVSLGTDFADRLIYTIQTEKQSKRYHDAVMIVRIHESGDFYNMQYVDAWLKVFDAFKADRTVIFQMYTKSFPLFLSLDAGQLQTLRDCMKNGTVAISLSLDDSMNPAQRADLIKLKATLPLANIYYAIKAEKLGAIQYDDKCDCADCAKCGHCVHTTGKTVAVAIH